MEWISVKNMLPEYGQQVIFVNGKNQVSVGQRFPYEKDVDIWSGTDSIYFNDSLLLEWAVCKLWMPLPEPPKE